MRDEDPNEAAFRTLQEVTREGDEPESDANGDKADPDDDDDDDQISK